PFGLRRGRPGFALRATPWQARLELRQRRGWPGFGTFPFVGSPGRPSWSNLPVGAASAKLVDQDERPRCSAFVHAAHFAKCADVRIPDCRSHPIENPKLKMQDLGGRLDQNSRAGPASTKIVDQDERPSFSVCAHAAHFAKCAKRKSKIEN